MKIMTLVLALVGVFYSGLSLADQNTKEVTCVLANPYYVGYCRQNIDVAEGSTPEESCNEVLRCLNNVQCINYCNYTSIRQFWSLVEITEQ